MTGLYAGLISGTSVDGVDAVLAEITDSECTIRRADTKRPPVTGARRTAILGSVYCGVTTGGGKPPNQPQSWTRRT